MRNLAANQRDRRTRWLRAFTQMLRHHAAAEIDLIRDAVLGKHVGNALQFAGRGREERDMLTRFDERLGFFDGELQIAMEGQRGAGRNVVTVLDFIADFDEPRLDDVMRAREFEKSFPPNHARLGVRVFRRGRKTNRQTIAAACVSSGSSTTINGAAKIEHGYFVMWLHDLREGLLAGESFSAIGRKVEAAQTRFAHVAGAALPAARAISETPSAAAVRIR